MASTDRGCAGGRKAVRHGEEDRSRMGQGVQGKEGAAAGPENQAEERGSRGGRSGAAEGRAREGMQGVGQVEKGQMDEETTTVVEGAGGGH
eukprot:10595450-Heterocapsa_arctica.AAC.1